MLDTLRQLKGHVVQTFHNLSGDDLVLLWEKYDMRVQLSIFSKNGKWQAWAHDVKDTGVSAYGYGPDPFKAIADCVQKCENIVEALR